MKTPKDHQQSTSSTFVVAPTDEVSHSSFHSAHPIMDKTPIRQNFEQDYSDMIVDSVHPEKSFVDQQVYDGTKAIKREISENQSVNGQPKNDPFTEILNSDEFTSAFASPKKRALNEPQKANKYMKLSAFNSPDDSTEQLIQLAPSKATHINMATAFLTSKKQWDLRVFGLPSANLTGSSLAQKVGTCSIRLLQDTLRSLEIFLR